MACIFITPEESEDYIKVEEDNLDLPARFYTIIPSQDPAFSQEEGWDSIVWFTARKKKHFAEGSPDHQWVYILKNEAIPDLLKIGHTDKNPYSRAKELSRSTGVPVDFEVAWAFPCFNSNRLEKEVHSELSYCRCNNRKEFFKIPLDHAIEVIERLGEKYQFQ